jgi:hypothetical protein
LALSYIAFLEARNVFSRTAKEAEPEEWHRFLADLNSLIYPDPMNWDFVRRDAFRPFAHNADRANRGVGSISALELH